MVDELRVLRVIVRDWLVRLREIVKLMLLNQCVHRVLFDGFILTLSL
jgi:hypothetical protein